MIILLLPYAKEDLQEIKPKKISWERNYSASYWFYSALKKSELHP